MVQELYTKKQMIKALAAMANEVRVNGFGGCSVANHKANHFWDTELKDKIKPIDNQQLQKLQQKIEEYRKLLTTAPVWYDEDNMSWVDLQTIRDKFNEMFPVQQEINHEPDETDNLYPKT